MPSRLALRFLQFQCFLLRRNWPGSMGDVVMIITTTGRRTRHLVSTPIGYVRDGDIWVALSYPTSNWYRNLRHIRTSP